jgi:hypothetical protein
MSYRPRVAVFPLTATPSVGNGLIMTCVTIHSMRLKRDGWKCVQPGKFLMVGWSEWETEQTEIWEKEGRAGKRLRRELLKLDSNSYGGPYIERYSLIPKNAAPIMISDATWAELDQKGKLVFARSGKVFRGALAKTGIEAVEIIDLNGNRPPERSGNNCMQATPRGAP